MNKIVLRISFGIKEGSSIPMITLQDKEGNTLIGTCLYNSIEELARAYQRDFEYRNHNKPFQYFMVIEGSDEEIQLFQKPVLQNYGEPTKFIDQTNI